MRDFSQRSTERELMDEGGLSFAEFHHCLQSLETINVLTFAYGPTLRWLRRIMREHHGECLRILDAGSGGGDMMRRVERLGQCERCTVELTGVDLNPWSKQSGELSAKNANICYETADIFSFEPERRYDLVICSLFTHHIDNQNIVRFLQWMDVHATAGWYINDLHRHAIPYYFIKAATALLSRNRMIRHDAAVSVARSFRVADWQVLLKQAKIEGARISWHFPFRLCVSCRK